MKKVFSIGKIFFVFLGLMLSCAKNSFADTRSPREDETSSFCSNGGSCSVEVDALRECLCTLSNTVDKIYNDPTWVWNSDQVNGVITLSESGSYRAGEDLIYPVEINGDKICFDLNCKELTSDDDAENVITVKAGKSAIRIFNGCIRNTDIPLGQGAGAGVLLEQNAESVQVDNINIFTCGVGVNLVGTSGNEVKECEFLLLNIIGTTTGILSTYGDNNVYSDCHVFESLVYGFNFVTSDNSCIIDCKAIDITGVATVAGFRSENGENNLFQGCVAEDIRTTGTDFGAIAYGIVLYENELRTKIIDCIINGVYAPESGWSHGIFLEPELDELVFDATGISDAEEVNARSATLVAWSPDERYVINVDSPDMRIYKVTDDGALRLVSTITSSDNIIRAVWSPDGRFIVAAASNAADDPRVSVYRFEGTQIGAAEAEYDPSGSFTFTDIDWSNDGKFIIACTSDSNILTFNFDGSGATASLLFTFTSSEDSVKASISPNSNYFATTEGAGANDDTVRVYSFDGTNAVIKHFIVGVIAEPGTFIEWSPNGKYIAQTTSSYVQVFAYNESTTTLSLVDNLNIGIGTNVSVDWSPDGNYLAVGTRNGIFLLTFDGSTISSLDSLAAYDSGGLEWSPSGRFIALGGSVTGPKLSVRRAMQVPGGILMKNNTVADVSAGDDSDGTGIMHTGCFDFYNLIEGSAVQNVCSSNEVNFGFGIPNTFWGNHNIDRPGSNISMPLIP